MRDNLSSQAITLSKARDEINRLKREHRKEKENLIPSACSFSPEIADTLMR